MFRCDPPHELPDQVPVGDCVIQVFGAWPPPRLLRLECPDDRIPGAGLLKGQRAVDARQAGLVEEQPAHRDLLLARSAELRPVLDHPSVEIELAALRQQMCADRSSAFGRGCGQGHGVFAPRSVRFAIDEAAPQVDHGATAHVDAARCADLAGVAVEVRPERIGHLPPAVLDVSPHWCPACRNQHAAPPFRENLRLQDVRLRLIRLRFAQTSRTARRVTAGRADEPARLQRRLPAAPIGLSMGVCSPAAAGHAEAVGPNRGLTFSGSTSSA
jgi:hypothetical protein